MRRPSGIHSSTVVLVALSLLFAGCPGSCETACANMAQNRYVSTTMQAYHWEYELPEIQQAITAAAQAAFSCPLNEELPALDQPWNVCEGDGWLHERVTIERAGDHYRVTVIHAANEDDEGTFDGTFALDILTLIDNDAAEGIREEARRRAERARGCSQRACAWVGSSSEREGDESTGTPASDDDRGAAPAEGSTSAN